MGIDQKYIEEYMQQYENDFGKPITGGQALVELTALVELMSTVNHYFVQHPDEMVYIREVLNSTEIKSIGK